MYQISIIRYYTDPLKDDGMPLYFININIY